MAGRGPCLEEILDVMTAVWTSTIVDIATNHERVAPSTIGLKPARSGGPRILLAATSPAGLDRIARRADGWLPFGLPLDGIDSGWTRIKEQAARHGRDPHLLQLVVRADPYRSTVRLGPDRPAFRGTCGTDPGDLDRLRSIGADEVIFDLHATARSVDELLDIGLALADPAVAA